MIFIDINTEDKFLKFTEELMEYFSLCALKQMYSHLRNSELDYSLNTTDLRMEWNEQDWETIVNDYDVSSFDEFREHNDVLYVYKLSNGKILWEGH